MAAQPHQQAPLRTGGQLASWSHYAAVFALLGLLTLVELGVAGTGGISRRAAVVALVGISVAKAALIALFYMHLRYETRILGLTVLVPLFAPAIYGIILIAEAGTRLVR